ncbi:MAG: tetratricopeptide repeat protein [Bacteroidetes bacterium]|nr:tetratricopeptide repeat protein [Bacteroidota bacterium]
MKNNNTVVSTLYLFILWLVILVMTPLFSPAQIQIQRSQPSQNARQIDEDERLASEYYRNKEYDKAAELYEKLYRKNPTHYYYTFYLYCLLQLEDYSEAVKLTDKQIKRYPGQLKFLVDKGYVYTQMGDTRNADKTFNEALEQLPANQALISELANSFYLRGQMDKAIAAYKHGRELLKGAYGFHIELANLYKLGGNYNEMTDELLDEAGENPSSLTRIQNQLQSMMYDDEEGTFTDYLWTSLLRRSQKDPDNIEYSELLMWLSIQQRDFGFALVQAKSIDRRYNEDGSRVFDLGRICLNNKDYVTASEAFSYVMSKGKDNLYYLPGLIGLLKSKYLKVTNGLGYDEQELLILEKDYEEAMATFGKYPETIELMKDLAHIRAFYLGKLNEAVQTLQEAIVIPGAPPVQVAECKTELGDIYLFMGEVWEATLLYSQVEKAFKNDPVGHEARLKNAKLTFYIGEFEWAKAQLDVLKAATSKLIANDAMQLSLLIGDNKDADSSTIGLTYYARADLLLYQNKPDLALQTLDSIYQVNLFHPLFDDILMKKAEIMMSKGEYNQADSLLDHLVKNFGYDILADDALYKRARLQEEHFGNKALAMELYQQILLNYPGSLFTVEARRKYRELRGDDI